MLDWMVWTQPVAIFFGCIALMLLAMTLLELRWPTVVRKGFLPIATTRGDRLFIGLLAAGYVNLIVLGLGEWLQTLLELEEEPSVWYGVAASAAVLALILRRG